MRGLTIRGKSAAAFCGPALRLGSGGAGGKFPYYFFLSEHYDWTVSPDWRGKHGLEVENEFRLAQKNASAVAKADFGAGKAAGRWRRQLLYQYSRNNLRMELDWRRVSDNDYLRDFDSEKSLRHLPARAALTYTRGNWFLRLDAATHQTLDDNLSRPARRLPGFVARHSGGGGGFLWNNSWRAERFVRPANAAPGGAPQGRRFVWRGEARHYARFAGFSVVPLAGAHAAAYKGRVAVSFFAPYMGVQAQRRITAPAGEGAGASWRLRLAHIVAPNNSDKQRRAPVFDSKEKRQTLQNIFDWSRHSGADRAAADHFVAYGAEYRRHRAASKEELFAGIAQRYYLRRPRALLAGEEPPRKGAGNLLLKAAYARANARAAVAAEWSPRNASLRRFEASAFWSFGKNRFARASYLSDDDETLFLGGAARWGRADFAAGVDYLLDDDRFSRAVLAARFRNACDCLRVSFKVEDSLVKTDDNDVSFSFSVEFVGLGNVGKDYEEVLEGLQ